MKLLFGVNLISFLFPLLWYSLFLVVWLHIRPNMMNASSSTPEENNIIHLWYSTSNCTCSWWDEYQMYHLSICVFPPGAGLGVFIIFISYYLSLIATKIEYPFPYFIGSYVHFTFVLPKERVERGWILHFWVAVLYYYSLIHHLDRLWNFVDDSSVV